MTFELDIQQYSITFELQTGLNSISYVPENVANKSNDVTLGGATPSASLYPTQNAVKQYADSLVTGLLDYRGNYDASVNTFPASGGSGTAGAVMKGDTWIVSVAGTLGGTPVAAGDMVTATVDSPGQTAGNWNILEQNFGYTPENTANKSTDATLGGTTPGNTLFPTHAALRSYFDNNFEQFLFPPSSTEVHIGPSSVAETELYLNTILANIMGTKNIFNFEAEMMVWNSTGANQTLTNILYHGGVSRISLGSNNVPSAGSWRLYTLRGQIKANTTNDSMLARLQFHQSLNTNVGLPNNATTQARTAYTLDTSVDQAFRLTTTLGTNSSAFEAYFVSIICKIIKVP